jgi:hypothetical protein
MMLIDKSIWGTEVITIPHPTISAPPANPPRTIPVPPVFPKDTRPLWLRFLEELAKPIFGGSDA